MACSEASKFPLQHRVSPQTSCTLECLKPLPSRARRVLLAPSCDLVPCKACTAASAAKDAGLPAVAPFSENPIETLLNRYAPGAPRRPEACRRCRQRRRAQRHGGTTTIQAHCIWVWRQSGWAVLRADAQKAGGWQACLNTAGQWLSRSRQFSATGSARMWMSKRQSWTNCAPRSGLSKFWNAGFKPFGRKSEQQGRRRRFQRP